MMIHMLVTETCHLQRSKV